MSNASGLNHILAKTGICRLKDPYSCHEISQFNATIDPILRSRIEEHRAYVHPDELKEIGLLDRLLNVPMRAILFSIMPDPVLYHCHVYEIAANDSRSHIFAETLAGWHRDGDCEMIKNEVTHVSVFVYLTEVGVADGAFEFALKDPTAWLHSGTPCITVTGPAGFTFAWQRSFYHRASPNRGSTRRRLFKISIQRNAFPSRHLKNKHFQRVIAMTPHGDPQMDLLLGRYQGKVPPSVHGIVSPIGIPIPPTGSMNLPNLDLAKVQIRSMVENFRTRLRRTQNKATVVPNE
jgi:hypothetical protein